MKLVTLIENTTCREDLACEHGLSLYLETGGRRILFDMGQSGAFADNAEKLGVNLSRVDLAIVSHGHYDHGGGMARFWEINRRAPVYVNQHSFEPHFNAAGKDIGLDPGLPRQGIRLCGDFTELAPGMALHTLPCPPEDTGGMTAGDGLPEDFRHEQYLLMEEAGRRILVTGCSHKGIVAIAEHFRPDILIGGFHFMKVESEQRLYAAAEALLSLDCVYYTGHCTGRKQYALLKARMGEHLHSLSTGTILDL